MRRLTASKFGLALSCVSPWTSGLDWDEATSYSATLGKAFHAFAEHAGRRGVLELVQTYGLTPALHRRMGTMAALWLDWWEPRKAEPVATEVKMAIDVPTGHVEVLTAEGERDYSQAPESMPAGSADLIHLRAQAVTDYKTGDFLEHPSTNPQMRLLSLMASRVYGWREVESRMEIFQERGHQTLKAPHSLKVIQDTERELHGVIDRMAKGEGPTPGTHCYYKFCPVRSRCPVAVRRPK